MVTSVARNLPVAALLVFGTAGQLSMYSASGGRGTGVGVNNDVVGADGGVEVNIPGIPGEDYPIYPSVPDTGFTCDGLLEGGYYADPAAECQAFHICANDGDGGLITYSVLCPNGTIFNQEVFVCDWWFNFDCSEAEGLYGLNNENAAEAAANSPADGASGGGGAQSNYGAGRRR